MTPRELLNKVEYIKANTSAVQSCWEAFFPEFDSLEARTVTVWLGMYDLDTIVFGLEAALKNHGKRLQAVAEKKPNATAMTAIDCVKYASGTMKRHKQDAQDDKAAKVNTGSNTAPGFQIEEAE